MIGNQSFTDAFPMIKKATVNVREIRRTLSMLRGQQPHSRILPDSELGDYIDCVTGGCDGGVFIGDVWNDMVKKRETDRPEFRKTCEGNVAWPGVGKCENTLEIKIHIDFR